MIARPGETVTVVAEDAPTGLAGTIGVRIMLGDEEIVERTTTGIVETPAGSGIYTVQLTAPSEPGSYLIVWDTGTIFASEALTVATVSVPEFGYTTPEEVHALNKGRPAFAASSRDVTLSDVDRYIRETAAVLDSILTERSYVAPIPTTAVLSRDLLGHYNALGAAYLPMGPHGCPPGRVRMRTGDDR